MIDDQKRSQNESTFSTSHSTSDKFVSHVASPLWVGMVNIDSSPDGTPPDRLGDLEQGLRTSPYPVLPNLISFEETVKRYREIIKEAMLLMERKNSDYGGSWQYMRLESITDQILVKVIRILQLERLKQQGKAPKVSEGIESEYRDILNYSVFALMKLAMDAEQNQSHA